jgi:hypothetical protein
MISQRRLAATMPTTAITTRYGSEDVSNRRFSPDRSITNATTAAISVRMMRTDMMSSPYVVYVGCSLLIRQAGRNGTPERGDLNDGRSRGRIDRAEPRRSRVVRTKHCAGRLAASRKSKQVTMPRRNGLLGVS